VDFVGRAVWVRDRTMNGKNGESLQDGTDTARRSTCINKIEGQVGESTTIGERQKKKKNRKEKKGPSTHQETREECSNGWLDKSRGEKGEGGGTNHHG
jgi:hypothetical protein